MATSRLLIYQGAALLVGELPPATLTDNSKIRRLLDFVWSDGGVRFCLEQAQWHFAMRSTRQDYDPAITPKFGYQRGYTKPSDWVATSGIFTDEYMREPLTRYYDEAGYWYSDYDLMYVRYVSDDSEFGGDFSLWPYSFVEYVKAYFAGRIVLDVPGGRERVEFLHGPPGRPSKGLIEQRLMIAKNKSAMAGPTTFTQHGTWVRARRSDSRRFNNDGGSTGSLIG